jgi:hypothetical protein
MWVPYEVAIHPHHVDIKITVLEGELFNPIYKIDCGGEGDLYQKFKWSSIIKNGTGGFEKLGYERLTEISRKSYTTGQSFTMQACEMHTVFINKGEICVWLIEESVPTCEYFPINYSPYNLTKWSPLGLYVEVSDDIKQQFIGKYLKQIS